MSKLALDPTASTPKVLFDLSISQFEISGRSMPENSLKFYNQVLGWLQEHLEKVEGVIELDINLEYYNTGTYVRLMEIFNHLAELKENGKDVKVIWYYDNDDPDQLDDGKAFEEVVDVPFEFMSID